MQCTSLGCEKKKKKENNENKGGSMLLILLRENTHLRLGKLVKIIFKYLFRDK